MSENPEQKIEKFSTASTPRILGVFSLTCLGINSVIGSGIFLESGNIAKNLGPWAPLGFLVGGLLITPIALCFAEMARGEGSTGGAYRYAQRAFGAEIGYLVGWVLWLSGVIGGASVARGFGDMLCALTGRPAQATWAGCALAVALAAVNWSGTRKGALSNNFLAVAKLLPLLLFAGWAVARVGPVQLLHPPSPPNFSLNWVAGLLGILYAFSGFEEVPLPAGETRDPGRTVGRALLLVLLISTGFYCCLQGAVGALGLAGSKAPLSEASSGVPLLGAAVTCAGLLSILSVNASIAFTSPRSLWSLADEGWLPAPLARLHSVRGTPTLAILVNLVLVLALTASGSFEALRDLSVLAALVQHFSTSLACWKLRGYPLRPNLPLVAVVVCLGLCSACERSQVLGLLQAVALGWIWSRLYRSRR